MPEDTPGNRAHRRRRLSGRDPLEEHRTATPLELPFDLTFVVAFGIAANELAHYVADGRAWTGIAGFAFASFAVAWAWINYSWFASAYDTDDWVMRVATMVQMVGVIVLALGLEQAFASIDDGDVLDNDVMVAGYVVMRVPMVFLWAASRAPRSGAASGGGDLHVDDLRRAGVLGRARDRRPADRNDVRDRRRAHWTRDGRSVHRAAPEGRDAVACRPHRGTVRPARHHHSRRGDHWHGRVDQRRRARLRGVDRRHGSRRVRGRWPHVCSLVDVLRDSMGRRPPSPPRAGVRLRVRPHRDLRVARRDRRGAARCRLLLEHETTIGPTATVASTTIPVAVYILALYAIYAAFTRHADPFHLSLLAGTAAVVVLSVVLAALGVGVGICLAVVMFAPVVTVLGYETLGHRHVEEALARMRAGFADR